MHLAWLKQAAVGLPARLWLVIVLWLAFAARAVGLDHSDLWLDEAISFFIADKPFREIILYTASQLFEHPPGYYLLLHFWMQVVGATEVAMRLLSAFGGVLAVALSASLARRWFGSRMLKGSTAGLVILVSLLMATQPMAISVSREVRMYGWMMVLALSTIHALDRAFARNRWRDWGLFLVTIGLSVLVHYLAGLFVFAYALFVVLFWRKLPQGRTRFAVILAILVGVAAGWVFTQAGPRDTLLGVLAERLQEPQVMATLLPVYTHWALGNQAFYIPLLPSLLLAALAWIPALVGVARMTRVLPNATVAGGSSTGKGLWQSRSLLRWLIILLLAVPPLLRSAIFLLPNARHSTMMMGLFILCAGLGLLAIWRRSRLAAVIMLLALLSLDTFLWARELRSAGRPFSAPLDYIQARARDSEPIVYSHPYDWAQNSYYNFRNLPATYIPGNLQVISDEEARSRVREILAESPSVWLNLYPSVLEPERVERAFNALAFPAEKVWFPGGRAVVYYVAPRPLQEHAGGPVWNEQIRLNRWMASDPRVAAGDVLLMEFEWQRTQPIEQKAFVALTLVGPDGSVWARRVAEPCNGLCPAPEWNDEPVIERQAFSIPGDVPPGAYQLRIAWLTPDGAPLLARDTSALVPQADLPLLAVEVAEPVEADVVSPPLSRAIRAAAGPGLTLLSVNFTARAVQPGQALSVATQWQVTAPQPALELHLQLERRGSPGAEITLPLGPAWYPSQAWMPDRTVRVQSRFQVPGTVTAGQYSAVLAVVEADTRQTRAQVALGTVQVTDRPRSFKLPEIGVTLDVRWRDSIRLARGDMPAQATAGDPVKVTLIWQADGPSQRNWKVFVHLVDAAGLVRAQGDAYPLRGEALTTTWQKGEVIADSYTINLPTDLPEGNYDVKVGFYDERSNERLPRTDGGDNFVLPMQLRVKAP